MLVWLIFVCERGRGMCLANIVRQDFIHGNYNHNGSVPNRGQKTITVACIYTSSLPFELDMPVWPVYRAWVEYKCMGADYLLQHLRTGFTDRRNALVQLNKLVLHLRYCCVSSYKQFGIERIQIQRWFLSRGAKIWILILESFPGKYLQLINLRRRQPAYAFCCHNDPIQMLQKTLVTSIKFRAILKLSSVVSLQSCTNDGLGNTFTGISLCNNQKHFIYLYSFFTFTNDPDNTPWRHIFITKTNVDKTDNTYRSYSAIIK